MQYERVKIKINSNKAAYLKKNEFRKYHPSVEAKPLLPLSSLRPTSNELRRQSIDVNDRTSSDCIVE